MGNTYILAAFGHRLITNNSLLSSVLLIIGSVTSVLLDEEAMQSISPPAPASPRLLSFFSWPALAQGRKRCMSAVGSSARVLDCALAER